MEKVTVGTKGFTRRGRLPPQDVDRYVGKRVRQRRIMLAMTQQQFAQLVGITYQQIYKYEKGADRITSGRLLIIARALDVDVNYFVAGANTEQSEELLLESRALFELVRNFTIMQSKYQEAVSDLARVLARLDDGAPC